MALSGRGGAVKLSTTLVADLREWNLAVDADLLEISSFGSSGWRVYQKMMTGAAGSASGYWNVESSTTMSDIQDQVLNLSTAAVLKLLVDSTGWGYSGSAFVSSLSPSAAVDGVVEFNFDFTYTGPVAYSTAY